MSKNGTYNGGATIGHVDPKRIDDVVVNQYGKPVGDVLAKIRGEKRAQRAKRAAHQNPSNFSRSQAWRADTGMVKTHQSRPRNAKKVRDLKD